MPKTNTIPKSPAENAEEMHFSGSASSMDCTGLIPNLPENEDAVDSYRDIYDFGPPNPNDYAMADTKKKIQQNK